jgi:integrase
MELEEVKAAWQREKAAYAVERDTQKILADTIELAQKRDREFACQQILLILCGLTCFGLMPTRYSRQNPMLANVGLILMILGFASMLAGTSILRWRQRISHRWLPGEAYLAEERMKITARIALLRRNLTWFLIPSVLGFLLWRIPLSHTVQMTIALIALVVLLFITSNETKAKVRLGELSYELKQKGWELPKVVDAPALRDLIPSYLTHISRRRAASWVDKQRQYLNGCVTRFFGADTKVSAISPASLEAYANDRCETVRGVTVNRELACLRSFFKWCKRQGYVAISPAAQIEFMDDEVQIVRSFLSEEEYSFLMEFAAKLVREDPYYSMGNHFRDLPEYIEWGCHTGERLGESLHAEWSDTSHGTLLIRPKPKHKFRLKSHQERQVPLCSAALHALDAMQRKRSKSSDFIFWRHGGIRDVQNSFARLSEGARKEMPDLHDVTIHTLRKTFASWLVQGGASLQEVKELLGHSTVQITERHNAYLAPKNLRSAVARLEKQVIKPVIKLVRGNSLESHNSNGIMSAEGGGRTPMRLPSRDFESRASASSATSAQNTYAVANINVTLPFESITPDEYIPGLPQIPGVPSVLKPAHLKAVPLIPVIAPSYGKADAPWIKAGFLV